MFAIEMKLLFGRALCGNSRAYEVKLLSCHLCVNGEVQWVREASFLLPSFCCHNVRVQSEVVFRQPNPAQANWRIRETANSTHSHKLTRSISIEFTSRFCGQSDTIFRPNLHQRSAPKVTRSF